MLKIIVVVVFCLLDKFSVLMFIFVVSESNIFFGFIVESINVNIIVFFGLILFIFLNYFGVVVCFLFLGCFVKLCVFRSISKVFSIISIILIKVDWFLDELIVEFIKNNLIKKIVIFLII